MARTQDLWENEYLLERYERIVSKKMREEWVAREIEDGSSRELIEQGFWNDYEEWAIEESYKFKEDYDEYLYV
jgi:hypothetical protein